MLNRARWPIPRGHRHRKWLLQTRIGTPQYYFLAMVAMREALPAFFDDVIAVADLAGEVLAARPPGSVDYPLEAAARDMYITAVAAGLAAASIVTTNIGDLHDTARRRLSAALDKSQGILGYRLIDSTTFTGRWTPSCSSAARSGTGSAWRRPPTRSS